ncbi:hypothetical protein EON77_08560, partial [bacterium]
GREGLRRTNGAAVRACDLLPDDELETESGKTARVVALVRRANAEPPVDAKGRRAQRVFATSERVVTRLLHLHTSESDIDTTPEHPFFVVGRGFVRAGDLRAGDPIATRDEGRTAALLTTETRDVAPVSVFNMRVENSPTYYVGEEGLLVHNGGPCVDLLALARSEATKRFLREERHPRFSISLYLSEDPSDPLSKSITAEGFDEHGQAVSGSIHFDLKPGDEHNESYVHVDSLNAHPAGLGIGYALSLAYAEYALGLGYGKARLDATASDWILGYVMREKRDRGPQTFYGRTGWTSHEIDRMEDIRDIIHANGAYERMIWQWSHDPRNRNRERYLHVPPGHREAAIRQGAEAAIEEWLNGQREGDDVYDDYDPTDDSGEIEARSAPWSANLETVRQRSLERINDRVILREHGAPANEFDATRVGADLDQMLTSDAVYDDDCPYDWVEVSPGQFEFKTCFVAGTPVATPTGHQAIEAIEPGDYVLAAEAESADPHLGGG